MEPAPFPRAVLTRGDNVGIRELLRARPDAMSAARDGLDPRYARTPCWRRRRGGRGARCPLARPADCAEWFSTPASGAAAAAGAAAVRRAAAAAAAAEWAEFVAQLAVNYVRLANLSLG